MSYALGGTPAGDLLAPTGFSFQSIDRRVPATLTTAVTAGTMYMVAIGLPSGFIVTTLGWGVGSTAYVAGTGQHYWLALYTSARAFIAQSTDDTAPVIGAGTISSKALSAPYTIPTSGLYYVGIMVHSGTSVLGTQPTAFTLTGNQSGGGQAAAVKLNGTSDTGLTTGIAPTTAAAVTQTTTGMVVYAG